MAGISKEFRLKQFHFIRLKIKCILARISISVYVVLTIIITMKTVTYNLENPNFDCCKYLLIRIKLGTGWIQKILPYYELF